MKQKNVSTKDKTFDVVLKEGVVVNAFNYISKDVTVGKATVLKPYNNITTSTIGQNCTITSSTIRQSKINREVKVGPNSHLRPNTVLKEKVKIGNFVEVKNSVINENTKASHLAYIGDAKIGKNCNIGCGVIFCNYDGIKKNKTLVKNGVFIGSNVNLVAPLTLNNNSFIAAGSTITKSVEKNALAIARARQVNKQNYNITKE